MTNREKLIELEKNILIVEQYLLKYESMKNKLEEYKKEELHLIEKILNEKESIEI